MTHGGFLGFGETKSFIPVDAVTHITDDQVFSEGNAIEADQSSECTETDHMDSPGLSRHEQQILRQIEAALEHDSRFGRHMHALERSRTPLTVAFGTVSGIAITAALTWLCAVRRRRQC